MPICFDLKKVKEENNCNIYFETGLWDVNAEETSLCKAITMDFDKCASVEMNEGFVDIAEEKFHNEIADDKLKLFCGRSEGLANYLRLMNLSQDDKILFFLDSHGSGEGCPLIEELDAIANLPRNDHVIMIDDVRIIRSCCWSDNRYKGESFETLLLEKLKEINNDYEIEFLDGYVNNDVLVARVRTPNVD
tara:strand:- start:2608 stop:3180 length:573 start_codon:yes stop_codon:yes gene_type:complete